MFAHAGCAINLQQMVDALTQLWELNIDFDSATHQSISYHDLRFRVYSKSSRGIYNLHGCALSLHDRHTGEVMHDMIEKYLSVVCLHWKIAVMGVA
jgi:hypothetical protein